VPWPVYSERILFANETVGWLTFTVPEKHRVIVNDIAVANYGGHLNTVQIHIHGNVIYYHPFQASELGDNVSMRQVAYERETIGIWHADHGVTTVISGYVMTDEVGRWLPPPEAVLRGGDGANAIGGQPPAATGKPS